MPSQIEVLIVILLVEAFGINQLGGTLPPRIDVDNARIILQSLVAFDGVLLGFGAIVFATLIGRESTFERLSYYVLLSMIATVLLYLLSPSQMHSSVWCQSQRPD